MFGSNLGGFFRDEAEQPPVIPHNTIKGVIKKEVKCEYIFRKPKNREGKNPLIIFLHAMGGNFNRTENALLINDIPKEFADQAFYMHPFSNMGDIFDSDAIKLALDRLFEHNPTIDQDRVYLTGYSMGGRSAWNMACDYPDLFAAAVPVCGFSCYIRAGLMRNVPTWAHHAINDDVVPYIESQKMWQELNHVAPLCIEHRLSRYREGGHSIYWNVYSNRRVWEWLFEQNRQNTKKLLEEDKDKASIAV